MGTLALQITANDLASAGAEPVGVLLTVLLPPSAEMCIRDIITGPSHLQGTCDCILIGISHSE